MNNAVITDGATLGEIPVLRAMAKVDVVLWNDEVRNEFLLQTVSVYHWQNRVALIPEHYNASQEVVTEATDTRSGLSVTPITYSGGDIDSVKHIKSKIYINETPNPGEGAFPEMPCLILGGYYKGETRYYRVDFFHADENGVRTYHDLLRNHHYELRVEKILTNGSGSEEEAYNSTTVNIETSIKEWNEGDMKNVIVDGEYWLRVDPAEFKLAREAHEATPDTRAERFSLDDYFFEIESNTEWKIDPNTIVYTPSEENDWFNLN
ncbi:MAG: hypothetical protein LUD68_09365, partial [Rikenellaceae bacterium]|nr:hypothetical protein [Rikenellaceae bacterium]